MEEVSLAIIKDKYREDTLCLQLLSSTSKVHIKREISKEQLFKLLFPEENYKCKEIILC